MMGIYMKFVNPLDLENPFKNLTKGWTTSPMKIVVIITAVMFGFAALMAGILVY